MRSFQNLVAFIFLITFFCLQQSQASRFLLKDIKTDQLEVASGSPSKGELNMQDFEGKVHAEMPVQCEKGHIHDDHEEGHADHHHEEEGCVNSVRQEFEEGDYIYSNSAP